MFSTTGRRRRRFITFVNRNLERILAVNNPVEGRVELVTDENTEVYYETTEVTDEDTVVTDEQKRRLERLVAILAKIPSGIQRRFVNNHVVEEVREAVRGLRLDQIPEVLLEQLNNIL